MDAIFTADSYNLSLVCIKDGKSYNLTGTNYTRRLLEDMEKLVREHEYAKIELDISRKATPERLLAFHTDGYILELQYKGHESSWSDYAEYSLLHLYEVEDNFKAKALVIGFDTVTSNVLEHLISNGKCNQII
ncbi:MAG: hypothetical protein J6A59_01845 [Lachnospiraceae bacterium]|nr:hypothetical protein [Lachnospiraceae bacterium]